MAAGDTSLIIIAYYFSYYLRFDSRITLNEMENFKTALIGVVPLKLAILYFFGIHDLIELINANIVYKCFIMAAIFRTHRFIGFSRGVFILI